MKYADDDLIAAWNELGSPTLVAQRFQCSVRAILSRRKDIEIKRGIKLAAFNDQSARGQKRAMMTVRPNDGEIDLAAQDGCVIVFSDAHFWPGIVTAAHRALVSMVRKMKPIAVIANGDIFDGASTSRHPRIGWEKRPTVQEELKAVKERMFEIEKAAGEARLIRTWGNHCIRFESILSQQAGQFEGVQGFSLRDHLPMWDTCWAVRINESTVVKHRWKGGIHAAHNNAVQSGVTLVTGHLHQLKVTGWSDYTGRRWGVDTGTLAEPDGPQFAYTERSPVNWASGFAVLTFRGGRLLTPEIARVVGDNALEWRGQILDAKTLREAAVWPA